VDDEEKREFKRDRLCKEKVDLLAPMVQTGGSKLVPLLLVVRLAELEEPAFVVVVVVVVIDGGDEDDDDIVLNE
jgi:hypothetical protein